VDSRITPVSEHPFFFKKSDEWRIVGNEVERVPGTWHDLRQDKSKKFPVTFLALWCCPACKAVCAVDRRIHDVTVFGHVVPKKKDGIIGTELKCANWCSFNRVCYFNHWSEKPLYAIAFERKMYVKGKPVFIPQTRYCHAVSELEARSQLALRASDRLVAIGPVIGYHVENEKDENTLTA
jgi:hypothetical protein